MNTNILLLAPNAEYSQQVSMSHVCYQHSKLILAAEKNSVHVAAASMSAARKITY